MPESRSREIRIRASDEKLKGEYSNVLQISHTKEEFILDFMSVFPPTATLNSRIIVSPMHLKRMLHAIKDNLSHYESTYGKVSEAEEPARIGFQERE